MKATPRATALLVGLTHVDPEAYPPDRSGNPWTGESGCWGCDDDVAAMRLLLERAGYVVQVLPDAEATVGAVSKALADAASKTKEGDTFLFYYSGHGGRIKEEGDDQDEADGWDETLCLFDGHLRDDILNEVWVRFPEGSVIYMMSDSCHSGTNYRAIGHRRLEPVDFIRDLNGDKRMKASLLHISGCRDEEYSEGAENGGLFTKALVSIWNKGRFTGTWDTFHDAISAELSENQRPQGNLYGKDVGLAGRQPFSFQTEARAAERNVPEESSSFPTLEEVARESRTRNRDAETASRRTSSLDELGRPGSREFIRSVQERLSHFGLYDPGAIDGSPGPFTDWALGEFKLMAGTRGEPGVGPRTAEALLSGDVDRLFPLDVSGDSFADRTVRLLLQNRMWICRHPDCINIVYLEGVDPDGRPNNDRPNVFNDLRLLIRVKRGRPTFAGVWEGTTEPGRYFTENPMNSAGAARIAFGQYYAWNIGLHNSDHEALRQVLPITVHRDLNKDYERVGDRTQTGVFYINQHWGYDLPVSNLGQSSAGCLVGRTRSGHREFMALIKEDARAVASRGYKFTTAVLNGRNLR